MEIQHLQNYVVVLEKISTCTKIYSYNIIGWPRDQEIHVSRS